MKKPFIPGLCHLVSICSFVGVASCGSEPARNDAPSETTTSADQAFVGSDGAVTVTGNATLNRYTRLTANAGPGTANPNSLVVQSVGALTVPGNPSRPLAAGDLLLVIQMQGATLTDTTGEDYGAFNVNNAGNYQLVSVGSIAGNTITIAGGCSFQRAFSAGGNTQVIRVVQATSLTVQAGAALTAPDWDGQTGGVVVVQASGNVVVDGAIEANAAGFRGGAIENESRAGGANIQLFSSGDSRDGGEKGEGIAGYQGTYDNSAGGRYGRGAPANAGGGGNSHNAGGGGGANAGELQTWSGHGVMNANDTGAAAWGFDPAPGGLTNSSGGGRGGYTFSENDLVATDPANPPDDNAWGGNERRERGGRGGRPVPINPASKLFLGGGGGAGDGNDGGAGRGGRGGGLVIILANQVSGTGVISADGEAGANSPVQTDGDAPGGGGAGGSIVLQAPVSGVRLSAVGGKGGDQGRPTTDPDEGEGPGGGGGGGYIALQSGAVTSGAAGGGHGITDSRALTEFPANGATDGHSGISGITIVDGTVDACLVNAPSQTTLSLTVGVNPSPVTAGGRLTYVATVGVTGGPSGALTFTDTLPAGVTNLALNAPGWICSGTTTITCTRGTMQPGQTATVTMAVDAPATGPLNNSATITNGPITVTVPSTTQVTQAPPAQANLALDLADSPDPVGGGGLLTYTATISNAGPQAATGVTFTDQLPAGAVFQSATPSQGTCSGTGTVSCNLGNVSSGGVATVSVVVRVPASGSITNTASVGSSVADPTPGNNTDSTTTTITPVAGSADVSIALQDTPDPVAGGGQLTYRATVTNAGPQAATGVVFTDSLPAGTTFVSATAGQGQCSGTTQVSCNLGTLASGASTQVTLVVRMPASGTVTNTVTALNAVGDPNSANNSASSTTTVTPANPGDAGAGDAGGGGDAGNGSLDTDGDGLSDVTENTVGTDPRDADSDDDGVTDGNEPSFSTDSDKDGLINALDPDSDNDGLFDGTELGLSCNNPATRIGARRCTPDADPTTKTNPLDPDTDDGSVIDGVEDTNLNGRVDAGERDPTTGHGADDKGQTPTDSDSDGLPDAVETTIGSDPRDADSDDDGVEDGKEPNFRDDTDGDGLINVLDPDSDNDALFDGTELGLGCSLPSTDRSKNQCRADENPATVTLPLVRDTDKGSVSDGSEDTNLNGKLDQGETDPTAGHGDDDVPNQDSDGDGLSNGLERTLGSNPNDADSDDDGLLDGLEPNPGQDNDGDGLKNILDPDSDGDRLFDGTEAGKDCSNQATNGATGRCRGDANPTTTTAVLDSDTDDGTVIDGVEDTNLNGKVDPGERDPNVRADNLGNNGDGGLPGDLDGGFDGGALGAIPPDKGGVAGGGFDCSTTGTGTGTGTGHDLPWMTLGLGGLAVALRRRWRSYSSRA